MLTFLKTCLFIFTSDKVDNSLENLDEQEKIWSELAQKKKEMKDKHKEFRDGLRRLENRMTDKDNSAGEFEDPRVYKLWALAQKTGLDEAELESIKVSEDSDVFLKKEP